MDKQLKILAWVEDPGASNFLDPVLENLKTPEVLCFKGGDKSRQDTTLLPGNIDRILDDFNPGMVLVGTSFNVKSTGLDLIEKARTRKIMSVGYVDARVNAERRFSGGTGDPLHFAPDWLLVPDLWTKKAYVKLGFDPTGIITCGHPHYDRVRNEYLKLQNNDKREFARRTFPGSKDTDQIVLYAAEPFDDAVSDTASTSQYTLAGSGNDLNRNRICLEEFLLAVENMGNRPYLVLRPHPRTRMKELHPYLDQFDHVSVHEPSPELIFTSDLVVGMTSMFLLEAVIMGRKVFSILPREEEKEWLPILETGLVPCFTRREDLLERFQGILEKGSPVPEGQLDSIFHFGATERVCQIIRDLLEGKTPSQEQMV